MKFLGIIDSGFGQNKFDIIDSGEWLLDIACGSRQLSVAALERGRYLDNQIDA